MEKQIITNIFLTKEDFANHAKNQQEEMAKSYGMTLQEWEHAILTQQPVTALTGSCKLDLV